MRSPIRWHQPAETTKLWLREAQRESSPLSMHQPGLVHGSVQDFQPQSTELSRGVARMPWPGHATKRATGQMV